MARIEPNPYSPYATADPNSRHLIPIPMFFPEPESGSLAVTGCGELAVVPVQLTGTDEVDVLPDGICTDCATAMATFPKRDPRSTTSCTTCGNATTHDGLCALCRAEKHDQWRANSAAAEAAK